ncbi:MAG: OmpA family protein [Chthoniobacterales bacterium]
MNGTIEEATKARSEGSPDRLIYRVEQIFLIHRETNRLLLHVADPAYGDDYLTVLSRVVAFAREYFFIGEQTAFEEFSLGLTNAWIALGPHAYVAAVIRGAAPEELRTDLQDALATIHAQFGATLANFTGDPSPLLPAGSLVASCLRSAYEAAPEVAPRVRFRIPRVTWRPPRFRPRLPHVRLHFSRRIMAALAGLVLIVAALTIRRRGQWTDFVERLSGEPGIVVMNAERHVFGQSKVAGLRDPLSKDPELIAREAKLDPAKIEFRWGDYVATDPAVVERRFFERFGRVDGAQVVFVNGLVLISGRVPNEWIERVRREATEVPGVIEIIERDLTVTFPPGRVLEQFRAEFAPPPTVHAVVANNTLVLGGSAPFDWIEKLRDGATKIPGITSINGDALMVEFTPDVVIDRFRERFGIPDGVTASFRNGSLILSGAAPHQWLDAVRRSGAQIPGVRVLDDRKVDDIDQRAFSEAKAAVDGSSILFVLNRDTLPVDASDAVARIVEQIKRSFDAAQKMGANVKVEVRGYGDASDLDNVNATRSKRRADAVRTTMINAGIDGQQIESLGMGTPPKPAPGEKPGAGQYDRRVFFKIVLQP